MDTHRPFDPAGWYPVEMAAHVEPGGVCLALLFGQEIALWRAEGGTLHAWENRCPHRSVRLTLGLVVGDQLACRYHGWRYGADGRCTTIPAHPTQAPPQAACVKPYAAAEHAGMAWVSLHPGAAVRPALPAGLVPCRGYTVAMPAATLAAAAIDEGFVSTAQPQVLADAQGWHLLLQPISGDRTGLHLLLPAGADRHAANATLKAGIRRWGETAHA